ncbi:MAG: class I SAM-dependent methyltransferase [Alphaproteobacteria bacterium]|nr:class I SAM-dependent methyltransferase [Alphaproteobacteria bacterium]MDE2630092.1 class I SAM-dependent methyltransferase [Alphaproteobacteria bacterium]
MGFYRDAIVPRLCDLSMRNKLLRPYRERVTGGAEGRVLEIGAGGGMNLPLYGARVTEILALEPDHHLTTKAGRRAMDARCPVTFLEAPAEEIPLDDGSIDTVVTTWTLCSIKDAAGALGEMRRVLRPNGQLLFVEHGLAPDTSVRRWQNRIDSVWTRVSGGCHLNRPIVAMIETSGFKIDRLDTGYAPGPKPMTFFYEGRAQPR